MRSLALLLGGLVVVGSASAQQATFSLSADPGTPVLVYRDRPGELAGAPARTLHVYADGRCELSVPAPRRGAGEYALHLSSPELEDLVRSVVDAGLVELDADALRARLQARAANGPGGVQVHVLDDESIEVELRLASHRGRGAAAMQRNVERRLRWHGLRRDLARHPEEAALRDLAALRDRLVDFMQRVDFRAATDGRP